MNRQKQRTVREGQFDRALEAFNQEIAAKTALTIGEYDNRWVEPLRARIDRIEWWLGIRAARWIRGKVSGAYTKVRDRLFPEPPAPPALTEVPSVEESVVESAP